MAILSTEINLYKSAVIADDTSNGGRRAASKISSNVLGNLIDSILPAELLAGFTKTRKVFYKIDNDADLTLFAAYLFLENVTPGDDYAVFYPGTARDTEADHVAPKMYGAAPLSIDATAGSSTVTVTVENSAVTGIISDGDAIYITDKATATATAGNREQHTVSGAPVVAGTTLTITIAGTLANSYTVAAGSVVSSAVDVGDMACSYDNFVVTGSGTYDDTTFPVTLDNLGTVEQTWTLEFLTATTYSCTGDTVGAVASGTTTAGFSPLNPATSKPYFTLASGGHGGTHVAGDTIVMQTHAAETAFYIELTGPAASSAYTGNQIVPVLLGASA